MTQASDLSNPGRLANHQRLRREAAWALSQAEVAIARGTDPERAMQGLRAFFQDCLDEVNITAPVYALTAGASPTSIVADDTATSTITINVKANGVNKAGETVTFAKSGAQAATCTLSATSAVTDASGNATVTVKGSAAGSVTITGSTHLKSAQVNVTLTAA